MKYEAHIRHIHALSLLLTSYHSSPLTAHVIAQRERGVYSTQLRLATHQRLQADWSQTFATTLSNEVLIELNLDNDRNQWYAALWMEDHWFYRCPDLAPSTLHCVASWRKSGSN